MSQDDPFTASARRTVRLATDHFQLGSVTIPPLEDGGETIVITSEGTEVTEDQAARAHAAANQAGFRLKEIKE